MYFVTIQSMDLSQAQFPIKDILWYKIEPLINPSDKARNVCKLNILCTRPPPPHILSVVQ